ncbi:ABC transporter ATP-binding protein [Alkalihalobacillus sp. 1P02AB]|uniref:ABC transporter ATP-binding protein n=1 Tax=Alkalihalobacillus sp. 1P02AB TaxID=3132260 RepID=UPI0039A6F7B5
MIHLHNVTYTYQSNHSTPVLQDISLHIPKGSWISLVGPSGSGKTTLLKLISGVTSPTSGQIKINGTDITTFSPIKRNDYLRSQVASVYQQFRLLPQFTVLENVMLPLIPYEKKKVIKYRAQELIDRVGLSHRLHHLPSQLSGGEQQRVSFARALITQPSILLCDEPTGNLDVKNRDNLLQLIRDFHRSGQTIIVATHDPIVSTNGDYLFQVHNGTIHEGEITHASV